VLLSPTNSCRGAWPIVSRIRAGQHLRIAEFAPGLVAQRERQLIAWQGQKVAQLTHQICHTDTLRWKGNCLVRANHIRQKHGVVQVKADLQRLAA
jgi:hypothetical protein